MPSNGGRKRGRLKDKVKRDMTEAAVVGALTEKFIAMVAQKLFEEVSLFTSFREEFEFFCDELISIKCLLNDTAERSNSTLMSNWLDSLEDFLVDAEDIVEECGTPPKFCNLIVKCRMGRKVKILKERISKINRSAKYVKYLSSVLHVNALNAYISEDVREKSSAFIRESHTLGMERDIDIITKWILEDGYGVIAILGMGGLGKTLLLQHVFKSEKVREHFDHFIWLSVSQKFVAKQLLLEIRRQIKLSPIMVKLPPNPTPKSIESRAEEVKDKKDQNISKQVSFSKHVSFRSPQISFRSRQSENQNLNEVSEEDLRYRDAAELRDNLHKYLQGKRCIFALDDVWDTDVFDKIGLPFDTQNNKIVFTSRDKRVADATRAHHTHHKTCLSEENSWKLFCIHAFPDLAEPPHELTNVARLIVNKCGGLPLAVKIIAASMARVGRLPNHWESTLHSLNQPNFMGDRVMQSLTLSYHALPFHLKHCFVYCSAFPRNSEIKSEVLVYLWIAQGLVSTQDVAHDVYDVGCSYLKELINRCLMEDSRAGYCKMHDLLHDLALSESLRQTKCLVKAGGQLKELPVEECRGLRRISVMKNNICTIKKAISCPGLRTLLLAYNNDLTAISASFFHNLRYLAVLDLSYTSINKLPETIGNLKHLKFLNLSSTSIWILPESLSGLTRLQFLDVSGCKRLRMLHSGIGNHKFMLHLNVKHCPHLECLPVSISKLIYLHTLKGAVLKRQIAAKANANALQLRDLKRLTLLQHLSLVIDVDASSSLKEGFIQLEEGTFVGMTNMRSISIKSSWYNLPLSSSLLRIPNDMDAMKRVEKVRLRRCTVPKWIFQSGNLMELEIEADNSSNGYDYRGLERIPNLRKLRLYRNEKCSEFPQEFGQPMAFPSLQRLIIEDFKSLTTFPSLQDNAMPMLQCLGIKDCCKLTNMPEGLEKLRSIEEVDLGAVDHMQYTKYVRHGQWRQILTDRGIKVKIDIV